MFASISILLGSYSGFSKDTLELAGGMEMRIKKATAQFGNQRLSNYAALTSVAIENPQTGPVNLIAVLRHLRGFDGEMSEQALQELHRNVNSRLQKDSVKSVDPWRIAKHEVEAAAEWVDLKRNGITNRVEQAQYLLTHFDSNTVASGSRDGKMMLLRERVNLVQKELFSIIDRNATNREAEIAFFLLSSSSSSGQEVESEMLNRIHLFQIGSPEQGRAIRVLGEVGGQRSSVYLASVAASTNINARIATAAALKRLSFRNQERTQ